MLVLFFVVVLVTFAGGGVCAADEVDADLK